MDCFAPLAMTTRLFENGICARAPARYLSPCGRGRIALTDAIRVRGYALSIDVTPLPNPLPQGERELTAVAGTSMVHFGWICFEDAGGLRAPAVGNTPLFTLKAAAGDCQHVPLQANSSV
jgi:hypothetical protein